MLTLLVPSAGWCWETAHGPPDNTGYVDVVTKPADYAIKTVGDLGSIAVGAGPVVGPDSTVYIVNEQGKLMSFKPDGTAGWSRTIGGPSGQHVLASPAVGSDGSIYVISVSVSRDHRGGKTRDRVDSYLHVFNSGGAYFGYTVFPDHNGGGGTTASPNIWRFNNTELVIVPALYGYGRDVRLLAFSKDGGWVIDQRVVKIIPEMTDDGLVTDSPVCWLPFVGPITCLAMSEWGTFPAGDGAGKDRPTTPQFPAVGIYTNPLGGTPHIVLSNYYRDVVGLVLSGGAFVEVFHAHEDNRFMRSAPAILPDKHAIIGTEDISWGDSNVPYGTGTGGVVFSGPNMNKVAPVTGLKAIAATPTRLANGRVVLIEQPGQMVVVDGTTVVKKTQLYGETVVSASASRTHLFVSTDTAIQTFDPVSLTEVSRMLWTGGGLSQPAIGPTGYVYAIANNTLYVFPPSLKQVPPNRVVPQTGVTVVSADTATQDSKPYKPPLTMSGNRLFACEKVDGDDCGKGDYQTIADAFCKKEGFVGSGHIQVDSKKVKAETLDGRYCSKKKCKVFEQIICANN